MRWAVKSITALMLLVYSDRTFAIDTLDLKTVANINGLPVTTAELKREMQKCRAAIYSQYARLYDISAVKDFWNTDFKGEKPIDALKSKALQNLIEIKVQQQLLEEQGLWLYKNYEIFLTALGQENQQRQQKAQRNEIIYGPLAYTEQTFFEYKFSNALVALKRNLAGDKIVINENLLMAHFEKLKEKGVYSNQKTFATLKQQVKDSYVEEAYRKLIANKVAAVKVTTTSGFKKVML